jgi:hypothetical protein
VEAPKEDPIVAAGVGPGEAQTEDPTAAVDLMEDPAGHSTAAAGKLPDCAADVQEAGLAEVPIALAEVAASYPVEVGHPILAVAAAAGIRSRLAAAAGRTGCMTFAVLRADSV